MNRIAGEIARAKVLEQKRHTAERPVGQRAASLSECAFVMLMDDGVELRIQALDSVDRGLHEFHRLRVAAPHHFGLRGRVEFREFIVHATFLFRLRSRNQSIGGCLSFHGRAFSNCAARPMIVTSSACRPTICIASGRPDLLNPVGTEKAG